jgi:hypothetical protein
LAKSADPSLAYSPDFRALSIQPSLTNRIDLNK